MRDDNPLLKARPSADRRGAQMKLLRSVHLAVSTPPGQYAGGVPECKQMETFQMAVINAYRK